MERTAAAGDGGVRVRTYRPDDGPILQRLEALCSQGKTFPVAFDHGEDYTVRIREHTDTTLLPGVIFVATVGEEEDGEVVCGVVSGVIKELLFASSGRELTKCGYVFSLRVHPDYRMSYGYIAEGNEASERFFTKNGYVQQSPLRLLGILMQNLPKAVPAWVEGQLIDAGDDFESEEKLAKKIDEAVDSIHDYWKQSDFLLPKDSLLRLFTDPRCSGPHIVTSPDGESQAGCGVWTHGYHIKLLGAPWYIRSGISFINLLAGYMPSMIPSLPDIDKKDHLDMRTVFGIWTKGPEGPALLTDLLEHLHNALAKARTVSCWLLRWRSLEDVDYLSVPLAKGHKLVASVPASSLIGAYSCSRRARAPSPVSSWFGQRPSSPALLIHTHTHTTESSTLPVVKALTSEVGASSTSTLSAWQQKGAAHKEQQHPAVADLLADLLPHFFDPRS